MLAICFEHVLLFENDETVNEKKRIYKKHRYKREKEKDWAHAPDEERGEENIQN